jgi:hypothetical protein
LQVQIDGTRIDKAGLQKRTIDYIFHLRRPSEEGPALTVLGHTPLPTDEEVDAHGAGVIPSRWHPSDHFCLVADFEFVAGP